MHLIFLYFFFFLGHGTYFSTLSPFAVDRYGESARFIFLAGQLLFPPGFFLTGYLSDRYHILRWFLVGSLILTAPAQILFYWPGTSLATAVVSGGVLRFLLATDVQLIAIAVLEEKGTIRFGGLRAWGTAGFFTIHFALFLGGGILAPFFPPFTAGWDASLVGQGGSIFYILAAFIAIKVSRYRQSHEEYHFSAALNRILQPGVMSFFVVSFFFYFAYQLVDYYVGQYIEKSAGMDIVYGGWALAVIFEIPFLALSGRLYRRHGIKPFFLLSTGAGALRFGWLALSSLQGWEVSPLYSQILHGVHFTGFYMGAIYWLRATFPNHLYGTGYGAYIIFASSLGGALGSMVFGSLLGQPQLLPTTLQFQGVLYSLTPYSGLFTLAALMNLFIGIVFFSFTYPQEEKNSPVIQN